MVLRHLIDAQEVHDDLTPGACPMWIELSGILWVCPGPHLSRFFV